MSFPVPYLFTGPSKLCNYKQMILNILKCAFIGNVFYKLLEIFFCCNHPHDLSFLQFCQYNAIYRTVIPHLREHPSASKPYKI